MKPLKEITIKCLKCGAEVKVKISDYLRMTQDERTQFLCKHCFRNNRILDEAETILR